MAVARNRALPDHMPHALQKPNTSLTNRAAQLIHLLYVLAAIALAVVHLAVSLEPEQVDLPARFAPYGIGIALAMLAWGWRQRVRPELVGFFVLWTAWEWFYRYGSSGVPLAALALAALVPRPRGDESGSIRLSPLELAALWACLSALGIWGGPADSRGFSQAREFALALVLFTQALSVPWLARVAAPVLLITATLVIPLSFATLSSEYVYFFHGRDQVLIHPEFVAGCFLLSLALLFSSKPGWTRLASVLPLLLFVASFAPRFSIFELLNFPATKSLLNSISGDTLLFGQPGWRYGMRDVLPASTRRLMQYPIPTVSTLLLTIGLTGAGLFAWATAILARVQHSRRGGVVLGVLLLGLPGGAQPLPLLAAAAMFDRKAHGTGGFWEQFTTRTAAVAGLVLLLLSVNTFVAEQEVYREDQSIVPRHFVLQLLAAEDFLFFHHSGVDLARLKWTIEETLRTGAYERGASTISMQLAKIRYLSAEKTIARKLQQLLLALVLEMRLSKQAILEQYLKHVHFGGNIWGVRSAANVYFGKDAHDLTPAESMLLVLTIENPERYHPHIRPLPASIRRRIRHIRTQLKLGEPYLPSAGQAEQTEQE